MERLAAAIAGALFIIINLTALLRAVDPGPPRTQIAHALRVSLVIIGSCYAKLRREALKAKRELNEQRSTACEVYESPDPPWFRVAYYAPLID
jgi:hypothetical protein